MRVLSVEEDLLVQRNISSDYVEAAKRFAGTGNCGIFQRERTAAHLINCTLFAIL